VSRYEDRWNEWDTQEATQPDFATKTIQVWRKKTTSTSTLQEEQTFDSSAGSDYEPEQ
jgi:hypothetical protein